MNVVVAESPSSIAAKKIAEQFNYGALVNFNWLSFNSGLDIPPDGSLCYEDVKQYQFAFLSFIESLKDILLTKHQMLLVNERGIGYRIAEPSQQTEIGLEVMQRHLEKGFHYAKRALTHVKRERLSSRDRQANNDALAMVGRMRQMAVKERVGYRKVAHGG